MKFEGKRVAVIGTGATGIQTITEMAKTAGQLIPVPAHAAMGRATEDGVVCRGWCFSAGSVEMPA